MKRILWAVMLIGLAGVANAQMPARTALSVDYQDRKTGQAISGTDTGRFQENEPNVIIVPDGTDDTVVCRYRSPSGNCYRLGLSDGKGHVPVTLIDKAGFDMWRNEFTNRDGWSICEVIENPWSEWQVHGSIPTAAGTHTYAERRYCSTGGNPNACANTCEVEYEERFQTITNTPSCVDSTWSPAQSGYYNDQLITQTSNCGNTRTVYGSVPRPSSCTDSSWSPDASLYYTDQSFWQTSNCGNSRYVTGTKPIVQQCSNDVDMRGMNPADFYTDECDIFYTGCGDAVQMCGTRVRQPPDPPEPPRCTPVAGHYEAVLYFTHVNGYEDFAEWVSGSSYDSLMAAANSVINAITSGGAYRLLYYVDNSQPGTTCP